MGIRKIKLINTQALLYRSIGILVILVIIVVIANIFGFLPRQNSLTTNDPVEKIYVALESGGKIAVIESKSQTVIERIDLSVDHEDGKINYSPHNIQVAPDGKSVWVTANASKHMGENSLNLKKSERDDEIIIINPLTDTIIKRVPIGKDQHLAHVVLSPDSKFAYATAQETGLVYKVNALSYTVEEKITVKKGAQPHGLRITPDGSTAYIALLKENAIGVLNIQKNTLSYLPIVGATVQTGVTLNGKYVVASVYDKKNLLYMKLRQKNLSLLIYQ